MTDTAANPYQRLYVYYFKGKIGTGSSGFGDAFIGNWEEDGFSFLFFSEPSESSVKQILTDHAGIELIDQYDMTFDEWHGGPVSPARIGKFVLTPPWETGESGKEGIRLVIDPGVVFGNGKHPTTSDCLELLCELYDSETVQTVSDLGTGTGVLAAAAALLGAGIVLAVDFNYLAARTARKNAVLNHADDRIIVIHGNATDAVDIPTDLMIANIHYDVMEKIIRSDGFLNHRWFILSGLLRSQAGQVADMLHQLPVQVMEERRHDGVWHTFFVKRSF